MVDLEWKNNWEKKIKSVSVQSVFRGLKKNKISGPPIKSVRRIGKEETTRIKSVFGGRDLEMDDGWTYVTNTLKIDSKFYL